MDNVRGVLCSGIMAVASSLVIWGTEVQFCHCHGFLVVEEATEVMGGRDCLEINCRTRR